MLYYQLQLLFSEGFVATILCTKSHFPYKALKEECVLSQNTPFSLIIIEKSFTGMANVTVRIFSTFYVVMSAFKNLFSFSEHEICKRYNYRYICLTWIMKST